VSSRTARTGMGFIPILENFSFHIGKDFFLYWNFFLSILEWISFYIGKFFYSNIGKFFFPILEIFLSGARGRESHCFSIGLPL